MLTPPVSLHWQVTTSGHSQVVELKEYHVPLKSEILPLNPAATDSNHNSDGNAPQELLITCMESAPQPTQPREVPHKIHLSSSLSLTSKLLMCSQTFFPTLNQYFKLTYLRFYPYWQVFSHLPQQFCSTSSSRCRLRHSITWLILITQTHWNGKRKLWAYQTLISHNIYWHTGHRLVRQSLLARSQMRKKQTNHPKWQGMDKLNHFIQR